MILPPERSGYPAPREIAERRRAAATALASGTWRTARMPVEGRLAGRRVLRFRPERPTRARLLHFHGGGYRIGLPDMAGPYAEALADRCAIEIVLPAYRLAPEHPFPSGLLDALACLTALRAEDRNAPLIVAGDSAGGGLAASLGAMSAVGEAPAIDGLVLHSPWLDLTVSAPSFAANADSDPLFSHDTASLAAELYLQGLDAAHPRASPLYADLRRYPPTLVTVGTGEVLRDDAQRFDERLRANGARSTLRLIEGMGHNAVVRGASLPGAADAFEATVAFVDEMLAETTATSPG